MKELITVGRVTRALGGLEFNGSTGAGRINLAVMDHGATMTAAPGLVVLGVTAEMRFDVAGRRHGGEGSNGW